MDINQDNKSNKTRAFKGFTLIEMLLVLTIASSIILLFLNFTTRRTDDARRDKTVLQIQQIMSAALAYYVNNSAWPITCNTTASWTAISTLPTTNSFAPGNGYLPVGFGNNAYGQPFQISCDISSSNLSSTDGMSHGGNFYIATSVGSSPAINAWIIAGQLPMAYSLLPSNLTSGTLPPPQDNTCKTASGTSCTALVASITIPGQNLNNARSVNFAGLYYSGSCVPAPNCPPGMSPSIFVVPASVSALSQQPSCSSSGTSYDPNAENCTAELYPLSSFTAFARGKSTTDGSPVTLSGASGNGPIDCSITGTPAAQACYESYTVASKALISSTADGTKYWRVCLVIQTPAGQVYPTSSANYPYEWGKMMGQVLAITRCVPNSGNETPYGGQSVWQPNQSSFVP